MAKQLNIIKLVFLCSLRELACAMVICDSEETMFFPEFLSIRNYTKCNGQMDEYSNRTLKFPPGVIVLDVSALGLGGLHPFASYKFLCDMNDLLFLNSSRNELTNIDEFLCSFPSLEILDLSRNAITVLQKGVFVRTSKLTHLYLAGNKITIIESNALSDLKRLRSLDLSDNDILGIKTDMLSGLTDLKYINFANNRISFLLDGAFSGLSSLESIDLSKNIISAIDKLAFLGVAGLRNLILKENQMKQGLFDFITSFEKLDIIDLSKNRFNGLETRSFFKMNVSKIVLSHTLSLKFILKNAFSACPFLEKVDLGQNQRLFYVHSGAFQQMPSQELDLSNSAIQYLHLKNLNNQTAIILNGTNLQCDCTNQDILKSHWYNDLFGTSNCIFTYPNDTIPSHYQNDSCSVHSCKPKIISKFKREYSLSVGERQKVACFAIGIPWPEVRWVKIRLNDSPNMYENISSSHWLDLHVIAINQGGKYGCIATAMNYKVSRFFMLKVKTIDMDIVVIARASTSIVVTWNKSHNHLRHVILHRPYEDTIKYNVQKLNDYWKIFKISGLKPATAYEICIGSALDINDRNCLKSSTTLFDNVSGIHTDVGVVIVLSIAGITFCICLIATMYKCIKKIKVQNKAVCMVNSLSREYFGDVKEATFTYENHFTDFVITEDEEKTEF